MFFVCVVCVLCVVCGLCVGYVWVVWVAMGVVWVLCGCCVGVVLFRCFVGVLGVCRVHEKGVGPRRYGVSITKRKLRPAST